MNVSQDGLIALDDLKLVPESEVDKDERWLRNGDVLFNNTNSPALVGKTAYYGFDEQRAYSNHMTRLRVLDCIVPQYLALFLHQLWRESYFEGICNHHVSQASISRTVLSEVLVSLPPLAEQRRIVSAVERILGKVSAASTRLERMPTTLKRFRQAVLAAACSGRLTVDWRAPFQPSEWRELPASELLGESLANGRSVQDAEVGIPALRFDTVVRHATNGNNSGPSSVMAAASNNLHSQTLYWPGRDGA